MSNVHWVAQWFVHWPLTSKVTGSSPGSGKGYLAGLGKIISKLSLFDVLSSPVPQGFFSLGSPVSSLCKNQHVSECCVM